MSAASRPLPGAVDGADAGGAAPARRRLLAQARMELRLLLRNGENLLVTLGLPAGLLVFFSVVDLLPNAARPPVAAMLPSVLAVAIVAAAMVALGIATGFDRSYLVLKRLGATPLRRRELVSAKIIAVLAVEVVQFAVVFATAAALGWRPRLGLSGAAAGFGVEHPLLLGSAVLLGTAAFAGIGLALAGRLPAIANLAAVNALFVVLLLAGGLVVPFHLLPGALQALAAALPAAPLAAVLGAGLEGAGGSVAAPLAVLAAWAVAAPAAAAWLFRWE